MEDKRAPTKFNQDILWNARIAGIINSCNFSAFDFDAHSWLNSIRVLRRELISLIKDEERIILDNNLKKIDLMMEENDYRMGRSQRNQIEPELYNELDKADCSLRLIAAKNGLLDTKLEDGNAPENW